MMSIGRTMTIVGGVVTAAFGVAVKGAISFEKEKTFVVLYENHKVGNLRVDMIIDGKVILEIKAVCGNIPKVFESQLISYLKISKLNVGLLINFGNKSCQVRRLMT